MDLNELLKFVSDETKEEIAKKIALDVDRGMKKIGYRVVKIGQNHPDAAASVLGKQRRAKVNSFFPLTLVGVEYKTFLQLKDACIGIPEVRLREMLYGPVEAMEEYLIKNEHLEISESVFDSETQEKIDELPM